MWWHNKKEIVTLVTHDGSFHADEVMATAILDLVLTSQGKEVKVIRSSREADFSAGDIVYDIGREYNQATHRYDHHQPAGAGERNSIPYASAGLIWKHYGLELVDNDQEVFNLIDRQIIQGIDAIDNGMDVWGSNDQGLSPFTLGMVLASFNPTSQETRSSDEAFAEAVGLAKNILNRRLILENTLQNIRKDIKESASNAEDKRIIVLQNGWRRAEVEMAFNPYDYPEVLSLVFPVGDQNGKAEKWRVLATRVGNDTFKNKQSLPEAWRGLQGEELQMITGVDDAIFCHRTGFLAAARSREGAIALARLALPQ